LAEGVGCVSYTHRVGIYCRGRDCSGGGFTEFEFLGGCAPPLVLLLLWVNVCDVPGHQGLTFKRRPGGVLGGEVYAKVLVFT